MIDQLKVGQVLEGKVTGIQPYGAFVAIDEQTQGLVHISEITHGYVKDIHDHLAIGDQVTVKVISVDIEKNKISLSIRATEEKPQKQVKQQKKKMVDAESQAAGFNTLKDKLEEWIAQTEEREQTYKQ